MREIGFVDFSDKTVCVNTILNTFYTHNLMLALAKSRTTSRVQTAVDRYIADLNNFSDTVIKNYAEVIFWYLVVICCDEVCHFHFSAKTKLKDRVLKRLKIKTDINSLIAELEVQDINFGRVKNLGNLPKGVELEYLLNLTLLAFKNLRWSVSYGGKRWKNIAETALKFYLGKIDEIIFLDTVFTLRHNGGRLFNKLRTFAATYEPTLYSQLKVQATATSMEELVRSLKQHHAYWEPGIVSLLRRGETFGYWDGLGDVCCEDEAIKFKEIQDES